LPTLPDRAIALAVSTEKVMFGNVGFGNIRFVTRMIYTSI